MTRLLGELRASIDATHQFLDGMTEALVVAWNVMILSLYINLATILIDNHDFVDVRYHKLIVSQVWAFTIDENPRMLMRRSFENYEEAASKIVLPPECTLHRFMAIDANGLRVEYNWHVKGFGPGALNSPSLLPSVPLPMGP